MPYTTADDGTRLFYKDLGQGPAVLMLHSWALHSGIWEYQLHPLLEAGYRIIAADRRGHGRSDYAATGLDFDTLADDLAAVLGHAGVTEHSVVAHSTGGIEAVHLAARRPGVRAIVLVAPIGPCMNAEFGPEPLEQLLAAMRTDRPQFYRAQDDAYFARPTSGASDALVDDTMAQILQTPLEVATTLMTHAWNVDIRDEVRSLTMPVLVLHGDADASADLDHTGRRYADLAPHARLSVVAGGPHGLYATHAERVTGEIVDFLESCHRPTPAPA